LVIQNTIDAKEWRTKLPINSQNNKHVKHEMSCKVKFVNSNETEAMAVCIHDTTVSTS